MHPETFWLHPSRRSVQLLSGVSFGSLEELRTTSWTTWVSMVELREVVYLAIDQDPEVLRSAVCGDFLLGINGELIVHSGVGVKGVAEAGVEY